MDEAGDDIIGWSADGLAAGVLGAAIGACLMLLGQPLAGVIAGPAGSMLALALLRQVKPEPRRFRLPAFEVEAAFEVQAALGVQDLGAPVDDVLELTEVAPDDEPLLLEDRLAAPATDSRVVQLFASPPLPTPGELNRRIEAHLAEPRPLQERACHDALATDASAALRQALGELRRSLR